MGDLIQARILKGFRDFLPDAEIFRSNMVKKILSVYHSFGFVPIDTPALEYAEILLRKSDGETEKQIFRFTDNGGRDIALRFDLTVPLARFVAQNSAELYFPFKCCRAAKVWRGEKPQAGRFREFMQCDIDSIGSDSASSDFEILNAVKSALFNACDQKTTIHINHRGIFNIFLKRLGVQQKSEEILRAVDKILKIGKEKVEQEIFEVLCDQNEDNFQKQKNLVSAQKILEFATKTGTFEQVLRSIFDLAGSEAENFALRMEEIQKMASVWGIENEIIFDPAITRGLDYYTGIVFETFLDALPSIGSVCSGGRYENLTGLYMKNALAGVGGSIGLDRLIAAMKTLDVAKNTCAFLDAEIFNTEDMDFLCLQKICYALKRQGIDSEIFPEPKKISNQYKIAEAKKIEWGIFCQSENLVNLKNLLTRQTFENITIENAIKIINEKKQKKL